MNKYKIYCDIDGVLTDFDKAYFDLTKIDIKGKHLSDSSFWEPIHKAGESFWIDMNWKKDGKKLWEYIEKYKPELLSAPSRDNSSRTGKMKWVEKNLPGVVLNLRSAKFKQEFADTNHILIDDRPDNIKRWIEAGGIGIVHTNTKDTIKELEELGL